MSTHKHIDRICVVITVLALLLTVLLLNGKALGIQSVSRSMGYENTLFDNSRVHSIDILLDDWDAFLETAAGEEYTVCSVVIDNEAVKNVAIRGKGNTSLSSVASMGSQRYSFKIEFDAYEAGKTYKGLDKLCLNNLIQDNTYMKDYLAYRLMAAFGVDTPLCSYAWVTVNGEDWGLYLAVEAVEDSFMERVYGGAGELYKPDSLSMGGGPGNGRDFRPEDFFSEDAEAAGQPAGGDTGENAPGSPPEQSGSGGAFPQPPGGGSPPRRPDRDGGGTEWPSRSDLPAGEEMTFPGRPEDGDGFGGFGGGGFGGMGGSDVKLQYTDDDPDSYPNIFDNAKTTVTKADKARLIRSLKALGQGEDLEQVLDTDELLRYFVVHNYLVNSDSYTGAMVHNYYLRESEGQLSMIPWDYNLAFGTFQGGDASAAVNDPIDTPLSVSGDGSRPLADWIFRSEAYTELYHQYFAEFLDQVDIQALIGETYELIAPYVEKDPTAFCSAEEFETAVETLRSFCEKRSESVRGQLAGTIPSTDQGQQEDASGLIDASGLRLTDMGAMGGGKGGPGGGSGEGGSSGQTPQFPGSGENGGPPSFGQGGGPVPGSGGFSRPNAPEAPPTGESADAGSPPDASQGLPFSTQRGSSGTTWPQILLSAVLLAGGLLTVLLYRKRA